MTSDQLTTEDVAIGSRALAGWEILSVLVSCLIAEWVVLSFFSRTRSLVIVPILLAGILVVVSHRAYGETLRDIGFRSDNFLPALRWLTIPTLATVIILIVVSRTVAGGYLAPEALRPRFLLLPLWALFQQYILQGYINRRAQVAFGKGWQSALVVAVVFSAVHLPNPVLSLLTLIGGFVWALCYQRWPNLFALAASHAVVSVVAALTLPPGVVNGLRVGFKYFG